MSTALFGDYDGHSARCGPVTKTSIATCVNPVWDPMAISVLLPALVVALEFAGLSVIIPSTAMIAVSEVNDWL